jgi:hypothetical protein
VVLYGKAHHIPKRPPKIEKFGLSSFGKIAAPERESVPEGRQIGAAMAVHRALGIARGSRGVKQAEGLPFVLRLLRRKCCVALGQ